MHMMRDRNLETMTGVCSICGPVNLVKKHNNWYQCAIRFNETRAEVNARRVLYNASIRAGKRGCEFSLNENSLTELMKAAKTCPVCGVDFTFDGGWKDSSMTLDRVDVNGGYTDDNVALICWRCNTVKSVGNAEDHQRIADWMKKRGG